MLDELICFVTQILDPTQNSFFATAIYRAHWSTGSASFAHDTRLKIKPSALRLVSHA
jgi:hypothetical protein